jgi:septal ring factor EnvC (AmiA/AmiB activator)
VDTKTGRSPGKKTVNSQLSTVNLLAACAAAVDELKASRTLITALDAELASQKSRLDTERQLNAMLTELNNTRKSESAALGRALEAKNETIAAKDAVIATQDKLIETLKSKRSSTWRRIGDILIGAAAIAVLK